MRGLVMMACRHSASGVEDGDGTQLSRRRLQLQDREIKGEAGRGVRRRNKDSGLSVWGKDLHGRLE